MSRRSLRIGSRQPSSPPAWGDPSGTAELYLLKVPVDRSDRSFTGKQVNLIMRLATYAIFLVRRTRIAVSRLFASLRTR